MHTGNNFIPFNKSSLQGRELEFIFQTISHGQIAGDQTFSRKCHGLLEQVVGEFQEIKKKSRKIKVSNGSD